LADSLEWELGQRYLQERGNKAFINDPEPVPYTINNDGQLSGQAAEVFFASLVAAEQAGPLEPDLFVLELGIGVGLFARFFLDAFRGLCAANGKDYYDRLCYIAADHSEPMLRDACQHGAFAHHPGRYLLRVVNALHPDRDLLSDPIFVSLAPRPFRAVFLNYLLDCLPAAVLQIQGETIRQLCVRTCLARGTELDSRTRADFAELAHSAASADSRDRRELLEVFGLLAAEYDYLPVDISRLPYGDFAAQFARSNSLESVLHSYGAIQCLEGLLDMVQDGGFILVNDYGPTQVAAATDFQHQRFSQATSVGLNFPLLKAYFGGDTAADRWAEPEEDNAGIHACVLAHQLDPETLTRFHACFGRDAQSRLQFPVQQAQTAVQQGRFEAALTAYGMALEQQPYNWVLMNEVAHFLTYPLRDPAAGLEMAKAALACNPSCSADLWNALGDSLFSLDRIEEAGQAFRRAMQINPNEVRARYKLACVYQRKQDLSTALGLIAAGFALDKAGVYRQGFLQKQSEILTQLAERNQLERQFTANRISQRHAWSSPDEAHPDDRISEAPKKEAGSLVGPMSVPHIEGVPYPESALAMTAKAATYMAPWQGTP
jgi:tetratricopeptide (TPR) repeat protein